MQDWLNFLLVIFILSSSLFYLGNVNFMGMLFFAEMFWIMLYSLTLYLGASLDDITLVTLSFFLLGFAGLEYCMGFLLLVLFKELNISMLLVTPEPTSGPDLNKSYYSTSV